jgi:cellulose synthase/poly-beta-1,6-N-acetylglucosamine synthase-like glycosyltransferase
VWNAVVSALNVAAAITITLSVFYYASMMFAGVRQLRRDESRLSIQGAAVYDDPFADDIGEWEVFFLVPCLNEEEVIGATASRLRGHASRTVVVVDDGSDDDTDRVARAVGDDVIVVNRTLPHARTGKGAALNAGFQRIREMVEERGVDPERVIVCVMDADGRLSDGALGHVLPLFEDETVGGVQLAVRIRNREVNFLTRFQDFQFWSMSAVTQFGRQGTQTVSLGGNGQFTRYTALLASGTEPWSNGLTEDLELALTLVTAGWRLQTTPRASVDQQGVEKLRDLFVQRRRWYQGHMMAGAHLPAVWECRGLSHLQALELTAYLAVPWVFDLPWSLLSHWTLFSFVAHASVLFATLAGPLGWIPGILFWYAVTFMPALVASVVYCMRDRRAGLLRSLLLGHSFLAMNYLSYVCVWSALARILRRRTGWDKTARTTERLQETADSPDAVGSAT